MLVLGARDTLDALTGRLRFAPSTEMAPLPCIVITNCGFGTPVTPVFSLPLLLFVKHCRGIVVVMARQAKGEHGFSAKNKYKSGDDDKDHKSDFSVESAEDLRIVLKHLVRRKFTSPQKIALFGGSHGGLAIGLSITKHPDLFGAAVVNNGLFDLLRYHLFNPPGVGAQGSPGPHASAAHYWRNSLWCEEYGCAEESPEDLIKMKSFSPLHNVGNLKNLKSFPHILLNTGNYSCKFTLLFLTKLS